MPVAPRKGRREFARSGSVEGLAPRGCGLLLAWASFHFEGRRFEARESTRERSREDRAETERSLCGAVDPGRLYDRSASAASPHKAETASLLARYRAQASAVVARIKAAWIS